MGPSLSHPRQQLLPKPDSNRVHTIKGCTGALLNLGRAQCVPHLFTALRNVRLNIHRCPWRLDPLTFRRLVRMFSLCSTKLKKLCLCSYKVLCKNIKLSFSKRYKEFRVKPIIPLLLQADTDTIVDKK